MARRVRSGGLSQPKPSAVSLTPAGAIPLPEALDIARQIAEALEAAHDKGSFIAISNRPT